MTCVYFIVVRVAEAILSSRRGDTLVVHHGLVPVAESVKSAALNPELFEEGIEVSLPTQVRIPRRAFARRKEETESVRSPNIFIVFRLHHLFDPPPHLRDGF
jgi:hypothetical protein